MWMMEFSVFSFMEGKAVPLLCSWNCCAAAPLQKWHSQQWSLPKHIFMSLWSCFISSLDADGVFSLHQMFFIKLFHSRRDQEQEASRRYTVLCSSMWRKHQMQESWLFHEEGYLGLCITQGVALETDHMSRRGKKWVIGRGDRREFLWAKFSWPILFSNKATSLPPCPTSLLLNLQEKSQPKSHDFFSEELKMH